MISRRRFVAGQECRRILEQAAERCLPLMLTNQADKGWQVYKANFLGLRAQRLVLSQPVSDSGLGHLEPAVGQEVAITFKKGYNKCLFTTRVIGQEQFEIEPDTTVPALVVYCPEQVEKVQRRAYNRVEPPAGQVVSVSFRRAQGDPSAKRGHGALVNLSAGGMGVKVVADSRDQLVDGEVYDLEFVPLAGQGAIRLQARLRHVTDGPEAAPGEDVVVGFQFLGLEMDEEGRGLLRRLGRVVSVYQRQQPLSQHRNLNR